MKQNNIKIGTIITDPFHTATLKVCDTEIDGNVRIYTCRWMEDNKLSAGTLTIFGSQMDNYWEVKE